MSYDNMFLCVVCFLYDAVLQHFVLNLFVIHSLFSLRKCQVLGHWSSMLNHHRC